MFISCHTFLSLDGVMQGPGAAHEDTSGGFAAGGWSVPYVDADFLQVVDGWFRRTDAVLLGRSTYNLMRPYWSTVTDPDNIVAHVLNGGHKYVVSTTLQDAEWGDTTIVRSLDEVRALKARVGGELQVHGSAGLAAALHEAGLIDEYRLLIFPVTLGAGKRLFGAGAPSGYELLARETTAAGVTCLELRPGPFRRGDFVVQDGKGAVSA